MHTLRTHIVFKYLWLFMALHILNCSVDAPDPSHNGRKENLNFNDQESIVEIVVEKILGFGDVMVEFDDDDSNENEIKKQFEFFRFMVSSRENVGALDLSASGLKNFHQIFALLTGFHLAFYKPPNHH